MTNKHLDKSSHQDWKPPVLDSSYSIWFKYAHVGTENFNQENASIGQDCRQFCLLYIFLAGWYGKVQLTVGGATTVLVLLDAVRIQAEQIMVIRLESNIHSFMASASVSTFRLLTWLSSMMDHNIEV